MSVLPDISHNIIRDIDRDAFDELSYAYTFDASYNQLTNFSQIPMKFQKDCPREGNEIVPLSLWERHCDWDLNLFLNTLAPWWIELFPFYLKSKDFPNNVPVIQKFVSLPNYPITGEYLSDAV